MFERNPVPGYLPVSTSSSPLGVANLRGIKSSPPMPTSSSAPLDRADEKALSDTADPELLITSHVYWYKLVPIGVLFAASLVLSNLVYLYLSGALNVPF